MQQISSRFVLCCNCLVKLKSKQQGFLLTELVCSLALAVMLAAMVTAGLGNIINGWQYLREQIQLQQAGYYMQSILEKNLSYNAVAINIKDKQEIAYTTILGNKSALFYCNKQGLYLRTASGSGVGTNPVFLPSYTVQQWQIRKVNSQQLYVSFCLQGKYGRRFFEQLLICCNGEIKNE